MRPLGLKTFGWLDLENPYAEEDVIELRHYKDKENGKVTWIKELFQVLMDSPRRPELTETQMNGLMDQSATNYFVQRVLTLLSYFDKKPLVMFLTIPYVDEVQKTEVSLGQ